MEIVEELKKSTAETPVDGPLVVAGVEYHSRLLVGTGKYRDFEQTREAIETSGAQIVTVAVRRTNIGQDPGEPNLLDFLSPDEYTILPNTAGCFDARSAVRTCRLAREARGAGRPEDPVSGCHGDARSHRGARQGRLQGDGLHQR